MHRRCLFWILITLTTVWCKADPIPISNSDHSGYPTSYKAKSGYIYSNGKSYDGSHGYSNSYLHNDPYFSSHVYGDHLPHSSLKYRLDELEKEFYELRQKSHFKDPFRGLIFVDKSEILAFRVTVGVGKNSYQRYIDTGNNDDQSALTLAALPCGCRTYYGPCDRHFRSRILDVWPTEFFKKVRVALYKDKKQVVFIDFDPANSTFLDFFRQERIIDSSYPDIATDDVNRFAIEGVEPEPIDNRSRRFSIYNLTNDCVTRRLYTLVSDFQDFCIVGDEDFSFPVIYYSPTDTTSLVTLEDLATADSLTVTVFLKEYGPEHRQCYP